MLVLALFTPMFAQCAHYRRQGEVLLLDFFLNKAEYRKAEECENDDETRNLEKEYS